MDFFVTVLGSSSATFHTNRGLTSHVINFKGDYFLVDCGEGTQLQLQRFSIPMQKISKIFITHLHGDHFFGLIGLLSTFHLFHRTLPLRIYCHQPLEQIIRMQLQASKTVLSYDLDFQPIEEGQSGIIYAQKDLKISTFPMVHSIPSNGFLFKECNVKRSIIKERIAGLNLPNNAYDVLKSGTDFVFDDGRRVYFEEVTKKPARPRSYAFCSDTGYNEKMIEHIKEVTVLYHEATYLKGDAPNERLEKYHATAEEAARIAKQANAQQLIIGHFSARYATLAPLLEEARSVFKHTVAAIDGKRYVISAKEDLSV